MPTNNTDANRLIGGYQVWLAAAGTEDEAPTMNGTTYPAHGTPWTQMPCPMEVEIELVQEWASLHCAFSPHPTDADLISIGLESIKFVIPETDSVAWELALASALSGTDIYVKQPTETSHLPKQQLSLVRKGPSSAWIDLYVPRVRRHFTMPEMETAQRGKLTLEFSVFADPDGSIIDEGACCKLLQSVV